MPSAPVLHPPVSQTPIQDARRLHDALGELVRVYQFRDRKRICYYDISVTQCYALESILRLGAIRVDRLAAELYLDKSTASRVVDSLEAMGYVERRDDPQDGRAVRVRATRRGRELHRRIERDLVAETRELIAAFDPEVRRATARLLGDLAAAARRRFSRAGIACAVPGDPADPEASNDA